MSTLYVDNLQPNLGSQVEIPDLKPLAGSVVQVVHGSLNPLSTSSSTFSPMGSLSITPTSSSSKILVTVSYHVYIATGPSNTWRGGQLKLFRDAVEILPAGTYDDSFYFANINDRVMLHSYRQVYDSPNTTSAVSYQVQGASSNNSSTMSFNHPTYGTGGRITLMEIAQ